MSIRDIIRRAGRSLRSAKIRTLLTSLAIAVGAFTLTLALAAGEGARQYTDKLVSTNVDTRSLIVAKDPNIFGGGPGANQNGPQEYDPDATSFGQTMGGGSIKRINQDQLNDIRNIKGVEKAEPVYDVTAKYFYAKSNPNKKFVTTVSTYDPTILTETTAGKLPPLRTDIKDDEVTIPDSYAKALGFNTATSAIGEEIVFRLEKPASIDPKKIEEIFKAEGPAGLQKLQTTQTKDVTVKIVATTNIPVLSFQGNNAIGLSTPTSKELSEYLTEGTNNYQKYIIVGITADSATEPEEVKKSLQDQGFTARTATDLQQFLFQIVNVLQGTVGGFGILALIASVFGIINTQYISVLERTQQIGLMKALGMRGRDVSRLFRVEAAWIGFLGGTIGALFATLVGTILNPVITDQLNLSEGTKLLVFQPLPIIGLIILLMLIAVAAGILPARKAARLDPIEALRTE